MKRYVVLLLLLFLCIYAQAQNRRSLNRAIGLRLGTPLGVTYKKYLPRTNNAVEFAIGTAPPGWNHYYYENSFHDFDRYEGFEYESHRVMSTLYVQGRYLIDYNIPIEGLIGTLDWYWGIGGVFKIASVEYYYRDPLGPDYRKIATDMDLGPEGIIGMEYTFERIPLHVFGEVSLMIEVADRPGIVRMFSGIGARYFF